MFLVTGFRWEAGDHPPTYTADVTVNLGFELIRMTVPVRATPELEGALSSLSQLVEDDLAAQFGAALADRATTQTSTADDAAS